MTIVSADPGAGSASAAPAAPSAAAGSVAARFDLTGVRPVGPSAARSWRGARARSASSPMASISWRRTLAPGRETPPLAVQARPSPVPTKVMSHQFYNKILTPGKLFF